ncbi:MAG TPA: four helix bundle protein [Terriglobia bacterium]|nr:four helix bundle protein [Terriglobia bacterium]
MSIERFEQLEVWQVAHQIVLDVYKGTTHLPPEEKFGLTSQMRRAAVSVPANIAEGFKRRGAADKKRFYNIAQGSLEELRHYALLCHDLGLQMEPDHLPERIDQAGRMLTGLIRSIRI